MAFVLINPGQSIFSEIRPRNRDFDFQVRFLVCLRLLDLVKGCRVESAIMACDPLSD